ncbi:Ribosomal protein S12p methylthiotransferase [Clostridiaceae bacterium JG1575]|nr:Ribosomal protein S12p methylthiotransferase [Clostridiaceae bacterium JG1575]
MEHDFIIKRDVPLEKEGVTYRVALVSLGCDKNRVDSEIMLGTLGKAYTITNDPMDAQIIIVNTCGFIDAAKEESIQTILEMAVYKKQGRCELLMATGCLTQRYGQELLQEMPELDVILGVNSYGRLDEYVERFIKERKRIIDTALDDETVNEGQRLLTTGFGTTAFLRIGEGCDMHCTYCIIPKIRGAYRSRSKEAILAEAQRFAASGVSELILVAQDTTRWGADLFGEPRLHELLQELDQIQGLRWIRLLYLYPEGIYPELLQVMAQAERVLPYFDMPIQHIADGVLQRMGRKTSRKAIDAVLREIRARFPNPTLRTTLITGFPGESEADSEEMRQWLLKTKLDKVGVFTYSREEGTPAYHMKGQIPEAVKQKRRDAWMRAQQGVSWSLNQEKIGRIETVLIEGRNDQYFTGRSKEMAPDIDGEIFIASDRELIAGTYHQVRITDALEYDLLGELI